MAGNNANDEGIPDFQDIIDYQDVEESNRTDLLGDQQETSLSGVSNGLSKDLQISDPIHYEDKRYVSTAILLENLFISSLLKLYLYL
jgi:hypothetical protein